MTINATLSDRDFGIIARYVEHEAGIRLPPHKRNMVRLRVARRLKSLGMQDFAEYVAYAFDGPQRASELPQLVDVITTNKTSFFREPAHFEYLLGEALPCLVAAEPTLGRSTPLVAWSAACSTGQEPYSMAMALQNFGWATSRPEFIVHATDICGEALRRARAAIYPAEHSQQIPSHLRRACLLRSRDKDRALVRVDPEIRKHVVFEQANLLSDPAPVRGDAHIVFCRNVLIYFERPSQLNALRRVLSALRPGGYLFVGHSEGLQSLGLPLRRVATSVYQVAR